MPAPTKQLQGYTGLIEVCTRNCLYQQIELVDPKVIVLLGSTAMKHFLKAKSVKEVRGEVIAHEGRSFIVT